MLQSLLNLHEFSPTAQDWLRPSWHLKWPSVGRISCRLVKGRRQPRCLYRRVKFHKGAFCDWLGTHC
jgi:hypothetical protein